MTLHQDPRQGRQIPESLTLLGHAFPQTPARLGAGCSEEIGEIQRIFP